MPWPVHPTGFLASRGDEDSYKIERSLRFNSADSAYLSRTPASAGNRKTWTLSFWTKKTTLGTIQTLFSAYSSGSVLDNIGFTSSDAFTFDIYSGSQIALKTTTQVFRDTSSWYHFVVVWDSTNGTATNRIKLYVNGSEITNFASSTNPNLDANTTFNNNVLQSIGQQGDSSEYSNGYLTEIHFIDGQALTPSSFGETDAITGRWKAKAYSGTYGTNGFYLSFKDNTSTTTLGYDDAGSNDWTLNNFSVTAGADNDSLLDSPTNSGTSGNYCTLNPLDKNTTATLSNGNLDFSTATSGHNAIGTIGVSSGKWYWEAQTSAGTTEARATVFGTAASSYYAFTANNTAYGFRFDAGAGTLEYTADGSTWTSLATGLTSGPYFPFFNNNGTTSKVISVNFGQRPFAYTAPTGFKALCTTNLSQPTIQKPSKYMDVVTYTGTGAALTPTSSLGFSPDLVWIKGRSGATDHALYDAVRGAEKRLESNNTDAEVTSDGGVTSFDSSGFAIGTLAQVNTNTSTYVAWAWDEAPIAGMDIVSYTGDNNSSTTIPHSLGVTPSMIIVKPRSGSYGTEGWQVWHKSLSASNVLQLHSTAAQAGTGTFTSGIISSSPTSSAFGFTAGSGGVLNVNASSTNYIAYLFAEVEGFSKFGSYTGNGSSDGPFVWCGFRPRWIMIKRTDSAGFNWRLQDTARGTYNQTENVLNPNLADAEATGAGDFDILSNGFKIRITGTGTNASGGTYIFAAFAESPFKYARAR